MKNIQKISLLVFALLLGLVLLFGATTVSATQNQNNNDFHCQHDCHVPTPTVKVTLTATPMPTSDPCDHWKKVEKDVEFPCVTPTITPEVTSTPDITVTPEVTQTPGGNGGTPPTFAGSSTNAPTCDKTAPVKVAANFHIYRRGGDAIAKWFPTEGDKAQLYFVNIHDANDKHALRDIDNDGYEDNLHLLGNKDWRFGIQQANGCADGPIVWVDDGATSFWHLFR